MFIFEEYVAEEALRFYITVRETNNHQLIKETSLLCQPVDENILHFIASTIISSLLRKAGAKIK
jgi:hypothetical protein